jgi:uncharacterized phiE125 gp8 family phage protein
MVRPHFEPVSIADMKGFLRIDHDEDDELIHMLIVAARVMIEAKTRRFLIEQMWRLSIDSWPSNGIIPIPIGPVLSLADAWVLDAKGVLIPIPKTSFSVDTLSNPGRLIQVDSVIDPVPRREGIVLDLHVGYGTTREEIPIPLRHAIRMLVAHWYENRGDGPNPSTDLPSGVAALIAPFKPIRL